VSARGQFRAAGLRYRLAAAGDAGRSA